MLPGLTGFILPLFDLVRPHFSLFGRPAGCWCFRARLEGQVVRREGVGSWVGVVEGSGWRRGCLGAAGEEGRNQPSFRVCWVISVGRRRCGIEKRGWREMAGCLFVCFGWGLLGAGRAAWSEGVKHRRSTVDQCNRNCRTREITTSESLSCRYSIFPLRCVRTLMCDGDSYTFEQQNSSLSSIAEPTPSDQPCMPPKEETQANRSKQPYP